MKLLDRYLLAQFTKYFFTITIAFVSLYLLIDIIERIDNLTGKGLSLWLIPQYFISKIPLIIDQLSPILILLSGVLTIGILNHNNEMVALKAGGIPLKRILRPIILPAFVLSILFIFAAQFIVPLSTSVTNNIWYDKRGKSKPGIERKGRYYFKGEKGFYSFVNQKKNQNTFKSFSYSQYDEKHNLQLLIAADKAMFKNDRWILLKGQVQRKKGGDFVTTPFEKKRYDFPETPANFTTKSKEDTQSLAALFVDSSSARTDSARTNAWVDFLGRLSYLSLGIPLMLIGLPVLLIMYRKWKCDLTLSIPVSCAIAFVAWGIWGTMQSLAKAGALSPLIASSAIHIVYGVAGIFLLYRENR